MIAARHVTKRYRLGGGVVTALTDVNVEIAAGDYVAVTGASGSGKSTFMNLIGALDLPSEGSLAVAGLPLAAMTGDELARFRNATVGFVFQQFNLLPRLDALANVALPLIYAGMAWSERQRRARASLARVGLADRQHHRPSELSGGQQQRVAIARALVNEPQILLADEPTGALDSVTSGGIMELFAAANAAGVTVVMVTHEPEIAARARRRLAFRDGRLVEGGA